VNRFVHLVLAVALLAPAAAGQTPEAHLTGLVTDITGSVIPRAAVVVVDARRHIERRVLTNGSGYYRVPFLKPGEYRVLVFKEGFHPMRLDRIRLEVGQVARLDFVLRVGTITETVRVVDDADLLRTEQTGMGQVIGNKRVVGMPLHGRNYLELAQLTVGVLPARELGRGARQGAEGGFIAVGLHAAQNNVLLDGNDNSSRTSGGPLGFEAQAVTPPVDAIDEFKVITNNSSAEFGYRAGAKVMVSTKSGTNTFHGSLYHFLRNDKFDGTNFFANRSGAGKPSYRLNQFGGTIGGPVFRNRTFFFFSYQGTRIRRGESNTSTVPSAELRAGDASRQPWRQRRIFDPASTTGDGAAAIRTPFPGNVVPRSRWDPVAAAVIGLYPLPNIPGRENRTNNYFYAASQVNDADQFDTRVDHNIGRAHRFFTRYSARNQHKFDPGPLPLPADGGLGTVTRLDGDNLAANLTSTFSSTAFNELRFGFSHLPTRFDIPYQTNLNPLFGIKGAPGDRFGDGLDHGLTRFAPRGFTQVGARSFWPNQNNLDHILVADSIMLNRGSHTVRIGGEFRRSDVFREAQRYRRGMFRFNGQFTTRRPNSGRSRAETGNAMADFLMGYASENRYGNAQGENVIAPYWGFFVQDDWKITPRLTLNIGLRYELFLRPTFPHPEHQTVGRWLLAEFNGVAPEDERMVSPSGPGDRGGPSDRNNLAPRLGVAYRLNRRTVLRAGGGIYYGEADSVGNEGTNFRSGPPRHNEIDNSAPRTGPPIRVQDGFGPFWTGVIPPNVDVYAYPNFRPNLYSAQWFFDIQRELPGETLLTIGYNGQSSSHLSVRRNINQPYEPHPTIRWQDRKIRPRFNAVLLGENSLNSNYNSLTLKAEKRFREGLTFLSSFTWSHNIDQGEEELFERGSGRVTSYDLSRERASSSLDRRFAFIFSGLYELPFGRGRAWLNTGPGAWFLGDWSVGGILSVLSGQPLDHSYAIDNQNNNGRVRGDLVRNPNLPAGERTIDRWFDTGFVTASAPGTFGNAGRNLILSPGRTDWNFILSRNFPMPWEGHHLQFRFEAFNFTNTPHFGPPDTRAGTPHAGRITTADEPRRIQFGLKYVF